MQLARGGGGHDEHQFLQLCKGAKLLETRLTHSDCDRIFLRSARPKTDGNKAKSSRANGGRKKKAAPAAAWQQGGSNLNQDQFVAALIRLAALKEPNATALNNALERLLVPIAHHVHDELHLVSDAFSEHHMASRAMKATLHKHREQLQTLFMFYASYTDERRAQPLDADDDQHIYKYTIH